MAKCRYCGREINPDSQFCPYCNCINPVKKDDASWSGNTKKEEPKQETNNTQINNQNGNINSASNQPNTYNGQVRQGQPVPPHQAASRPPKGFNPPLDKISGMAIAGFVCSFIVPFIGLPFSITAYDRARYDNYKTNTKYAKAGIIISVIMLILWAIGLIVGLVVGLSN